MPTFGSIKRNDLIRYLRMLGFEGPYSGGKHQFMVKETLRLTIPNPHQGEISKALLGKILRQAVIRREEWENLR
ncbi:MAG: type II toxin-antitoxin system HicA family toxin [Tildeniella torsiva UHER 1998/13D]|jgi:predicted RNA binding protein YcfA (HicA-like mRNA interferase family)|nr:type II toxin-antitoxin system HicA family toxin [Tildeniella torsiva UHER 1998/13D]